MKFNHIKFSGWRQFNSIDIEFHPRLTVLTGANGSGKTTILTLLSRHFGWDLGFTSTPRGKNKKTSSAGFSADYWNPKARDELRELLDQLLEDSPSGPEIESLGKLVERLADPEPADPRSDQPITRNIGEIAYSNGMSSILQVPVKNVGATYNIGVSGQQPVEGIHIASHRPYFTYQKVEHISTTPETRKAIHQEYLKILLIRAKSPVGLMHKSVAPNQFIKSTLIALATWGYGNQYVDPNPESRRIFERFQDILAKVMPSKLQFKRLAIRVPEVVLVTGSGEFSLDAVSGGVASIIDVAWQICMFSESDSEFVVTIDEPENHLHPELQRSFLPSLLEAFPSVQFIVASHNPFMIGSVPDSHVYVLRHNAAARVQSVLLDTANRAGTSNEILREVLGLEVTMPIWVEERLESFVAEFQQEPFTTESLGRLRQRMTEQGLERYVPETIAQVAHKHAEQDQ